jgi:sugar O-acyltransferase (sialic acid O-acetyltransferase NeuD family)
MTEARKLVIFGSTEFAEIAYEYFTYDSDYEVAGFTVEQEYLKEDTKFRLPMVPFETVESVFPPVRHDIFIASVYTQLNRLRTRLLNEAKSKGYKPASYISSRAFVWRNVDIGEHCFIFEDNTVQPFVKIGNNVVMWSGNHIGHHSIIGDNCFISSHVVVSGGVTVGNNCFLGINATINNAMTIGNDCLLGSAALVVKNLGDNNILKGTEISKIGAKEYFKIKE